MKQQKFLARVEQGREYQDGVGTTLTLPRMSFEVMGMNYDATRKVSTMQTFKSVNKKQTKWLRDLCLFHIISICNLVSLLS